MYCPITRRACREKRCKLYYATDCVFNMLVDALQRQNILKERELRKTNGGGGYEQQAQGQRRGT